MSDFSTSNETVIQPESSLSTLVRIYNIVMVIWPIIWFFLAPTGLVLNVLNIRTFLRIGLDDSVTIAFFTLAVSDACLMVFPLVNVGFFLFIYIDLHTPWFFKIDPFVFWIFTSTIGELFHYWTTFITTFLAVQKCLCVLKPFHFKLIFTNSRTIGLMVMFFCICALIPIVTLTWGIAIAPMDVGFNRTQYRMTAGPYYSEIEKILGSVVNIAVLFLCCGLCLISTVVVGVSLISSLKFRLEATGAQDTKDASLPEVNAGEDSKVTLDSQPSARVNLLANTKERRTIIQVALVTALFLISSMPKVVMAVLSYHWSETGRQAIIPTIMWITNAVRLTFEYLNSTVNFAIYYHYNTKFRNLCFNQKTKVIKSGVPK